MQGKANGGKFPKQQNKCAMHRQGQKPSYLRGI